MIKLPVGDKGDYWLIDSWDNVFTARAIVSREDIELYKGLGFLPQIKINQIIERAKQDGTLSGDYDVLGYEDEDVALGYQRTVTLAKLGHFRYVVPEPPSDAAKDETIGEWIERLGKEASKRILSDGKD
jgi:hypothetical protein